MRRRQFLYGSAAAIGVTVIGGGIFQRLMAPPAMAAPERVFEITRSEAEWREVLSDMQYRVLREEATERAFTSPLNNEKRAGMYHCAGCEQAVYSSATKYDSGTGWPSFWDAEVGAIGTKEDNTLFMTRTECHCARCGSHLGHIFDDGPEPTGRRHCINGVAMTFRPQPVAG